MPVEFRRERSAGERVKEEIAFVGEVLDARCDVDLRRHPVNGADVGNDIAFETLEGVADDSLLSIVPNIRLE